MTSWWPVIFTIICISITEDKLVLGQQSEENVCGDPLKDQKLILLDLLRVAENKTNLLRSLANELPLVSLTEESSLRADFREVVTFKNSRYVLSKYPATAFEGNFICSVYGGYLAEFNDEEELSVFNQLDAQRKIEGSHIGVNDIREEGEFVFSYSGARAFTKFNKAEPNGGTGQNCVYYAHSWGMSDIECTRTVPFICEIPMTT
ncbi:hypothetical protein Btru_047777 [Bulinus truncatus]|nr:hypothetical protein Btru_047777 [Bulinus truncatus]